MNVAVVTGNLMVFEFLIEITLHYLLECLTNLCKLLNQILVKSVQHCNKFAIFDILVQSCLILVRNAKLGSF